LIDGDFKFNTAILRASDIRGVYGSEFCSDSAYLLGKAFASKMAKQGLVKLCLGRDGRVSSPMIHEALVKGLIESGVDIYDIGVVTTPMMYYCAIAKEFDAGIMITASHNPKEYNGLKMLIKGQSLLGEEIRELGQMIEHLDFITSEGKYQELDISEEYALRLLKDYEGEKPLKIIWDCGNGAAGAILSKVVSQIKGEHIIINGEVDGNFPSHHPDPSEPKNMSQLIEEVKRREADFGIAFDGDADRIGVALPDGEILYGDDITMFLAEDVVKNNPLAKIIVDVKVSQRLINHIKEIGGLPIVWKTGHSFIKRKMLEEKALLAGEMSGHIFFADKYYGFDDAIYSAVRLVSMFSKDNAKSISERYSQFPRMYNLPEIRIEVDKAQEIIDEIKQKMISGGRSFCDLDGIRFIDDSGWWLLRSSNTQPAIIARCEACSKDTLAEKIADANQYLAPYNIKI